MMAMLLQLALMCVVLPAHGVDDTKTSLEEPQWYKAAEHLQSWIAWAKEWQGTHDLMCLDLFGASNKIQACWTRRRFMASAFDIAQDASQDIVSPTGFAQLVNLGLRLAPNAIVVGGPPCSWFGFMSSSVHLRHRYPPNGATWIRGVRLSNLIVKNMVAWVCSRHFLGSVQDFNNYSFGVDADFDCDHIGLFLCAGGLFHDHIGSEPDVANSS